MTTLAQDSPQRWPPEGYSILRNVLGAEAVAAVNRLLDAHRTCVPRSRQVLYTHQLPSGMPRAIDGATPPSGPPTMDALMEQWLNPHLRTPQLSTLPVAARLREQVRGLLSAEPVLFQDLLMSKNPSHRSFPFHQDFPFWPVAEPLGGVLWVALDPVDAEAGGLTLASGSHVAGIGPPIDLHRGVPQPGFAAAPIHVGHYARVTPELNPGDAIWFHALLWHGSGVNLSGRQRRVWASTWLPAHARWSRARAPRHPAAVRVQDGAQVGESGWVPLLATPGLS